MARRGAGRLLPILFPLALGGCRGGAMPNLPFPTLGGTRFWADRWAGSGWRIQENVWTGHCRLLDPGDVRRAFGSFGGCLDSLEGRRRRGEVSPPGRRLVVLVHGIGRTRGSLRRLDRALRARGYDTLRVSYPSTFGPVAAHAERLAGILGGLAGVEEVSFVTHSMGGLVVREALALGSWKSRTRLGRLAMLAPPSRGSVLAERLRRIPLYRLFLGPAGEDLTPAGAARIPAPAGPFGIVAGGRGDARGKNPLVPGDDDGKVGVEEARLPGAEDFLLVDRGHTWIMDAPEVIDAVVRYLETGRFTASRPPPGDPPDRSGGS